MDVSSKRKVLTAASVAVLILWVLWICHSLTGTRRPFPMKANQLIRRAQNTNYSKLNLTYDRIVLPESNLSDVFISTINPKQVASPDSVNDIWINAAREAGFRVVIPPDCEIGHRRTPLCCKVGYEFEQYYKATEAGKRYRWYCHFDDDEYVNIPVLMRTLRIHKDKSYLGRIPGRYKGMKPIKKTEEFPERKHSLFRYATGAAVCISSVLMPQMERYIRGSALFSSTCEKLQSPDDVAIGAIVGAILGYNMTEVPAMVNQMTVNRVGATGRKNIKKLVTISYTFGKQWCRRVTIPGAVFTKEQDPTSFLSYHCLLYPSTSWCKQRPKKQTNKSGLQHKP